jgi:organic radical activating enzyme
MKLSIIDWRITSKCNNNCEFCYGNKGINTTQNFDKIIENIKKSGCEAVCITGGEPLLEDKVYYILEKLHNLGISIYLSTNGTNYMLNKNKIEPYISKLSGELNLWKIFIKETVSKPNTKSAIYYFQFDRQ